ARWNADPERSRGGGRRSGGDVVRQGGRAGSRRAGGDDAAWFHDGVVRLLPLRKTRRPRTASGSEAGRTRRCRSRSAFAFAAERIRRETRGRRSRGGER